MIKTMATHRKDQVIKLLEAIWTYNVTWKSITGFTPYELVYEKNSIMPIEYEIETLRITTTIDLRLSQAKI